MALNKNGNQLAVEPMVIWQLGTPQPAYIPLADVAFGGSGIVFPQPLPPTSQVFPSPEYNRMLNIPGVHVLFDERRNGVAF